MRLVDADALETVITQLNENGWEITRGEYKLFEHGYIDDSAVVFCNHCKISVKLEENDQEGYNATTKRKAIEAWNRRAERRTDEHDDIFE